eukprot:TRINITY_DN4347_c0_g1_i3.p1 TRINITY_DN4347_c0_g1~~TRINITY_DN4347_c0_g1_i3.p1  ORF type:complete len:236 (-),score=44.47 TRINITY_DN4347_c0_g1_i3:45-752(-)
MVAMNVPTWRSTFVNHKISIILIVLGLVLFMISLIGPAAVRSSVESNSKGTEGIALPLELDVIRELTGNTSANALELFRYDSISLGVLHIHLQSPNITVYLKIGGGAPNTDTKTMLKLNNPLYGSSFDEDICEEASYYIAIGSDDDQVRPYKVDVTVRSGEPHCTVGYFGGALMETFIFVIPLVIGLLLILAAVGNLVLAHMRAKSAGPAGRRWGGYKNMPNNLFIEDSADEGNL